MVSNVYIELLTNETLIFYDNIVTVSCHTFTEHSET